jgi:hypothetical protein
MSKPKQVPSDDQNENLPDWMTDDPLPEGFDASAALAADLPVPENQWIDPEYKRRLDDTDVRIVREVDGSVLIQWHDGNRLHRGEVPLSLLHDQEGDRAIVKGTDLQSLPPYGEHWESLVQVSITPDQIAVALRQNGIWTAEDATRNENLVLAAFRASQNQDYADFIEAVRSIQKGT